MRCPICRDPKVSALLSEMLATMDRLKAHHKTIRDIHERLVSVGGLSSTFRSTRNHLNEHAAEAWRRAKGR